MVYDYIYTDIQYVVIHDIQRYIMMYIYICIIHDTCYNIYIWYWYTSSIMVSRKIGAHCLFQHADVHNLYLCNWNRFRGTTVFSWMKKQLTTVSCSDNGGSWNISVDHPNVGRILQLFTFLMHDPSEKLWKRWFLVPPGSRRPHSQVMSSINLHSWKSAMGSETTGFHVSTIENPDVGRGGDIDSP